MESVYLFRIKEEMTQMSKLNELIKDYEIKDADIALVQVSKAKSLGQYSLMEAENPVYIVSFTIGH